MIAYKVVRRTIENQYCSAIMTGDAQIIYSKEKENFPPDWLAKKGYNICCFKTLRQAQYFKSVRNYLWLTVWKVKGERTKLKPLFCITKNEKNIRESTPIVIPKGTIMLKSVTFIEELL